MWEVLIMDENAKKIFNLELGTVCLSDTSLYKMFIIKGAIFNLDLGTRGICLSDTSLYKTFIINGAIFEQLILLMICLIHHYIKCLLLKGQYLNNWGICLSDTSLYKMFIIKGAIFDIKCLLLKGQYLNNYLWSHMHWVTVPNGWWCYFKSIGLNIPFNTYQDDACL